MPLAAFPNSWKDEKSRKSDKRLSGFGSFLTHFLAGTTPQSMTADTFLSMLLARKWDYRAQAAIVRLTRNAAFRYMAYLEQIDYATNWGLEHNQMERLVTLDFVRKGRISSLPALQVREKAI